MQLYDKDLLSMQEVRELVGAAKKAQGELAQMSQEKVDHIVKAVADAGVRNARRLAIMELGLQAPVRLSGDVEGSGAVVIEGPKGSIQLTQGVMIAHNHIHLTPETAEVMNLQDHQRVSVEMLTERPVVFRDVIVRVNRKSRNRMHIDFDEANAARVSGFTLGRVLRQSL